MLGGVSDEVGFAAVTGCTRLVDTRDRVSSATPAHLRRALPSFTLPFTRYHWTSKMPITSRRRLLMYFET